MAFDGSNQESVNLYGESDQIDHLLVNYLDLLDQYENLRKSLYKLQGSMLQNISKANFNANRGIRYGEDFYDTRMQALRLCVTTKDEKKGTSIFTVDALIKSDLKTELDKQDEGAADKFLINRNSIRMFGILTPQALRLAQNDSVKMVEEIIPEIATVNAEMIELEIQIRRARELKVKPVPN